MGYNISANLWYQYFNGDGQQWLLLLFVYTFRAFWASIGIMSNFGIVYITVKSSNLSSICNILIAMESAFSLILDLGYFVSFFVVLSGVKFIRYGHCFWALIVPCIFGEMAQLVMLFTGLDRLCAVAFPFWYKQRNPKKYLALVTVITVCHGTYDFVLHYIDYKQDGDIMLSCSTNEMHQGFLAPFIHISGLTLSALIIIVYLLCLFVFKSSATTQHVTENNRKLTKSLLFIVGLNLIGVFTKITIDLLLKTFVVGVNELIYTPYSIAFSFVTITVYSINAPVLYIISSEYRAQFDHHFPCIATMFSKITLRSNVVQHLPKSARPWVNNNGIRLAAVNG